MLIERKPTTQIDRNLIDTCIFETYNLIERLSGIGAGNENSGQVIYPLCGEQFLRAVHDGRILPTKTMRDPSTGQLREVENEDFTDGFSDLVPGHALQYNIGPNGKTGDPIVNWGTICLRSLATRNEGVRFRFIQDPAEAVGKKKKAGPLGVCYDGSLDVQDYVMAAASITGAYGQQATYEVASPSQAAFRMKELAAYAEEAIRGQRQKMHFADMMEDVLTNKIKDRMLAHDPAFAAAVQPTVVAAAVQTSQVEDLVKLDDLQDRVNKGRRRGTQGNKLTRAQVRENTAKFRDEQAELVAARSTVYDANGNATSVESAVFGIETGLRSPQTIDAGGPPLV